MTRSIVEYVEQKIVQWEGEVLHAYDDFDPKHEIVMPGMRVRGTLTAGVGHTGPDVKPGMRITMEQSRKWLHADLDKFEALVERAVKVELSDYQFGALVSFAMNVGESNFLKSTLLKKLNAGDYDAVPSELMKWVHSKGKKLNGLVNRRAQEGALWGKGEFVSSASVDTAPEKPPAITKENVSWFAALLTSIGINASTLNGWGPLQITLLVVLGIAGIIGAYLFLSRRLFPK